MAHEVALFVGTAVSLRPFAEMLPEARAYTLTPDADIAVLPFNEALEAALQRRFGTGDWPEGQALLLSSTVQTFAAECSQRAPLAYLETHYDGAGGQQAAVLWQGGRAVVGPATLDVSGVGRQRVPTLWPINVVLRTLGVRATASEDEFSAFGLGNFRSNDRIHERAWPFRV
jgi:hypothetical protein